jgi:hypothetical protein
MYTHTSAMLRLRNMYAACKRCLLQYMYTHLKGYALMYNKAGMCILQTKLFCYMPVIFA